MKANSPNKENIFGDELEVCSCQPMTGYFRDGYCQSVSSDAGAHIVCAVMTDDFLKFSLSKGNDLITPHPQWGFPRLKEGDSWCLCAMRWKEAFEAGHAPPIKPKSTSKKILEYVPLSDLEKYFIH
jgi:uncharacterized protein (DUF2237 family)